MAADDTEALEERFVVASAQATRARAAGEGRSPALVAAVVEGVFEDAVAQTERVLAHVDPLRRLVPVCAAGCSSCCHTAVLVTPAEALYLAAHLRATRSPAELALLAARVREIAERIRPWSTDERWSARVPCALLDGVSGSCTVHEARPEQCRAHNSLDRAACERNFETRNARLPIPVVGAQKRVGIAIWLGSVAGLAAEGLEADPLELHAALAVALEERTLERWLAGERPFAAAASRVSREAHGRWAPRVAAAARALGGAVSSAPVRDADAARRERNRRKRARK
jgi:Fe-S-cluster containining protein